MYPIRELYRCAVSVFLNLNVYKNASHFSNDNSEVSYQTWHKFLHNFPRSLYESVHTKKRSRFLLLLHLNFVFVFMGFSIEFHKKYDEVSKNANSQVYPIHLFQPVFISIIYNKRKKLYLTRSKK